MEVRGTLDLGQFVNNRICLHLSLSQSRYCATHIYLSAAV